MSLLLLFGNPVKGGFRSFLAFWAGGAGATAFTPTTTPTPTVTPPTAAPDRGWPPKPGMEEYFRQLGQEKVARLRRDDEDILRLMELEDEFIISLLRKLL